MASIVGRPSGASVPGHARTGLERGLIFAAIWIPGANPFNVLRGARVNAVALAGIANLTWLRRFSPGMQPYGACCAVGARDYSRTWRLTRPVTNRESIIPWSP